MNYEFLPDIILMWRSRPVSETTGKAEDLVIRMVRFHEKAGILETMLEEALCRNLEVVEEGLRLAGRQVFLPEIGRIDVLAYDGEGNPVVVEVKSGMADDSTLTQLLSYMSGVAAKENKNVRGIIVAEKFARKLAQAVKQTPNIKLVEIEADIEIKRVRTIAP